MDARVVEWCDINWAGTGSGLAGCRDYKTVIAPRYCVHKQGGGVIMHIDRDLHIPSVSGASKIPQTRLWSTACFNRSSAAYQCGCHLYTREDNQGMVCSREQKTMSHVCHNTANDNTYQSVRSQVLKQLEFLTTPD